MSDLEILDRAFASLTRDLAHSPGPGAAAAMSTARTRRRTKIGAVALATLVVVGGGLTVPRLVFPEDGVAAYGGSAPLDSSALERATDGWLTGWEEWSEHSPKGGGGYTMPACFSDDDLATKQPQVGGGLSRFLGSGFALGIAVLAEYPDAATAERAQSEAYATCRGATTIPVDGVQVRHYAEAPSGTDTSLTDVWTAQIGAQRLTLEIAGRAGTAPAPAIERVAEALVAGLRAGEVQETYEGDPHAADPDAMPQLPEFPSGDLDRALAGWRAASRGSATSVPDTPCLGEEITTGSATGSGGGTPDGVTWSAAAFHDEDAGYERVEAMVDELRDCTGPEMTLEGLSNGVTLVTYDTGGPDGRGAIWLSAVGDRAGLVAVDGADRQMPTDVAQDVATVLHTYLRLP